MLDFIFVVLAVFWAWSTLRYAVERFFPSAFTATRVLHPFAVAGGTTYLCYPDLVQGLAAAGVVGLLVASTDRALGGGRTQEAPVITRRRAGLPDLP